MAIDATGAPTSLGIPKLNTAVDAPSGNGTNAMMDAIDALIAARIAKSVVTAAGDLIVASGNAAVARLGVGSNGQVLTASGGTPVWAAASSDWQAITAALTYSSTDGHTFVATTSTDLSGVIPLGARIKLTNNAATQYFIVTAISAGTITLYGGTTYSIIASAITSVSFSQVKAPVGFPLDPTVWSEENSAVPGQQATPTAGTWYNNGGSLVVPIGSWKLMYDASLYDFYNASGGPSANATLSTGAATESDSKMSSYGRGFGTQPFAVPCHREKYVLLAAKQTFFLNSMTSDAGASTVGFAGSTALIRATCAYL